MEEATSMSIRNIEDLLKNVLKPGETVVASDVSRLTAPGENYGSIMLRVLVTIKNNETNETRQLDTVAKTIPESEITQEVFDTQVTFRNELGYYSSVVPTLDKLLKSKGFQEGANFAAPFYGGRINLTNSGNQVDSDGVILMANLRSEGYTVGGKKQVGVDIDTARVTLDSLAKLHASGLAVRLQQPELFEKNIRPYFYQYKLMEEMSQMISKNLVLALETSGFTKEEIERTKYVYDSYSLKENVSQIWGTVIHYDAWTNNILIKDEDSKPKNAILVDFQVFEYGTPLDDLAFFLFTSVQQDILEERFDELLDYFYDKFVNLLNAMDVDTTPFTRTSFNDELAKAVRNYDYYHSIWMLQALMDEDHKTFDEWKDKGVIWTPKHIDRIKFITRLCFNKNWF